MRIYAAILAAIAVVMGNYPIVRAADAVKIFSTALVDSAGFGESVGVYGDYAITGAPRSSSVAFGAGEAFIFVRSGNSWSRQARLTSPVAMPHDYFGSGVAISDTYAVAGAFNADGLSLDTGAAYVFKRNGTLWPYQVKLNASDGSANDYFGYSVGISGSYIIAGAYRDADRGVESGSAYIFGLQGSTWVQQAKLTAPDGKAGDNFGRSVAISGDCAIAGAIHNSGSGTDAGAAYIFRRSGSGWVQEARIVGTDTKANDYFGFSVGISGNRVIVGADAASANSGSAYIFKYNGSSWVQEARLVSPDSADRMFFGRSVSISGNYALVGADGHDGSGENAGAAWLFKWNGSTWTQQARLSAGDIRAGDRMGSSVAVFAGTDDIYTAVAGVAGNDSNGTDTGAAYLSSNAVSETGTPDIDVSPLALSFTQTAVSSGVTLAPPQSSGTVTDAECGRGLIIPDSVREYWENRLRPPQQPGSDSLPSTVSWRSYDSAVKSQGSCGSCAVFAAVALMENIANHAGLPVSNQDLSEQALLSCSPDITCLGGWYWDALYYAWSEGVPPETCSPYTSTNGSCSSKCTDPDFLEKVTDFTSSPGLWGEDQTVDDLRKALQDGPLCVSMRVPPDGTFSGTGYKGGVYNYNGGYIPWDTNGHAVLVVGYDDAQQCFIVKNSWGSNWGEAGYFRISYDDVTDDVKFGSYACQASGPYLTGKTSTFTVSNTGTANLAISRIQSSKSWLSVSPSSSLTIPPNGQQVVTVQVANWASVTIPQDTARIFIYSNDPDEATVTVTVTAQRITGSTGVSPGDIDGLNGTTLADAIIGLKVLSGVIGAGNSVRSGYATSGADINGDGRVGLEEVIYILKDVSGQ